MITQSVPLIEDSEAAEAACNVVRQQCSDSRPLCAMRGASSSPRRHGASFAPCGGRRASNATHGGSASLELLAIHRHDNADALGSLDRHVDGRYDFLFVRLRAGSLFGSCV